MNSVLMKCGCRANTLAHVVRGKIYDPPIPSCVIHDCIEQATFTPDLAGRIAKCGDHAPKPSSLDLPFFEYCGPGSREATDICVCGYHKRFHEQHFGNCQSKARKGLKFEERGPREFDRYYCGCRGWD